jgi:hypothetical protein
MFAQSFLDLKAFATPKFTFFLSPFLGLIPALITQLFLLRRIALFLSSLASLWPRLARKEVKFGFVGIMSIGMGVAFCSGAVGTWGLWKGGPLWMAFLNKGSV